MNRVTYFFVAVACLLLCCNTSTDKKGNSAPAIIGTVAGMQNGLYKIDSAAFVYLVNISDTVLHRAAPCDSVGAFSFNDLQPGKYILTVHSTLNASPARELMKEIIRNESLLKSAGFELPDYSAFRAVMDSANNGNINLALRADTVAFPLLFTISRKIGKYTGSVSGDSFKMMLVEVNPGEVTNVKLLKFGNPD